MLVYAEDEPVLISLIADLADLLVPIFPEVPREDLEIKILTIMTELSELDIVFGSTAWIAKFLSRLPMAMETHISREEAITRVPAMIKIVAGILNGRH